MVAGVTDDGEGERWVGDMRDPCDGSSLSLDHGGEYMNLHK